MNRATSLTIIALGAILTFAISASPKFLNLQVVGWILMATGAAGLVLERRGRDWLRRTVIVRGSSDIARSRRRRPAPISSQPPPAPQNPASPAGQTQPADQTQPIEQQPIERETIEEYIEQ